MKRALGLGASAAATLAVAACALLDDPQQCSTDDDCARFGAVCDVAQAICVASSDPLAQDSGGVAEGDAASVVDASVDAPLDPRCMLSPKPTANPSAGLPPGPDGGAQVSGSLLLDCDKDWLLEGPLVVPSGATLTIRAGTTIRAKKATAAAIVVSPGARIVAEGQREHPIVMTVDDPAPQPGDWRGLFVLGAAPRTGTGPFLGDPLLSHGGANAADDSGVVSFVRIEYADQGIVLASAGNKTKVDHVQVRRANDNCFVFTGGTVDAKHLVCQHAFDEQFEINQGYTGRLQFLFGQKIAPGDGHNGILIDGASTAPVLYNATVCGQAQAANVLGYGLVFRNGAKLDASALVLTGWYAGVDAVGALAAPVLLRSSIAYGNATNPAYGEDAGDAGGPNGDDDNGFDELGLFADAGNRTGNANLVDCHDPAAPKPWTTQSLAGAQAPPNDGFFDTTATFVGAFRDANDPWMTGAWVRFAAE